MRKHVGSRRDIVHEDLNSILFQFRPRKRGMGAGRSIWNRFGIKANKERGSVDLDASASRKFEIHMAYLAGVFDDAKGYDTRPRDGETDSKRVGDGLVQRFRHHG
jgi:hypothetical protein